MKKFIYFESLRGNYSKDGKRYRILQLDDAGYNPNGDPEIQASTIEAAASQNGFTKVS